MTIANQELNGPIIRSFRETNELLYRNDREVVFLTVKGVLFCSTPFTEPVEKPVIANQSAFLVWQSPNFSGPKLIGSTLKLGDSHASVRYFLGMTLTFLTH